MLTVETIYYIIYGIVLRIFCYAIERDVFCHSSVFVSPFNYITFLI